jgi:hypothetical protein
VARQEAECERKAAEERKVSEYLAAHGFKDVLFFATIYF